MVGIRWPLTLGDRDMTQKDRLIQYLEEGNQLTRLNAWDHLGILEAPARISELRQKGHKIYTTMTEVTNRYGEKVRIATWSLTPKAGAQ